MGVERENIMGDTLIPKKVGVSDESALQKSGFGLGYDLQIPLDTAISEGSGLSHNFSFTYEYADSFKERFPFTLQFGFGETEGKLFASTFADGTTTTNSRWSLMFGMGKGTRSLPYFNDDGDYVAGLSVTTTSLLGVGSTEISHSDQMIDDKLIGYQPSEGKTFNIGTRLDAFGEFHFSSNRMPTLRFGPSFYYGTRYGGADSDKNGLDLTFMVSLQVLYGDGSVEGGGRADGPVGAMHIGQYIFGMGHGWVQSIMMNKVMNDPNDALSEYGLETSGGSGGRGSMANVPAFQMMSSFLGATGNSYNVPLRAGTGWFYGLLAARTLGDGLFFMSEGEAGKAGAVSGLLDSAGLALYPMFSIETPEKREHLSKSTIARKTAYIDLIRFGLGVAMMGIGAAAKSDILSSGAVSSNLGLAFTPDPLNLDLVERTDYGYAPMAYITNGKTSGWLSGIMVHNSFHDIPYENFQLFTELSAFTPSLRLDNVANHSSQSEPYEDVELASFASSTLGLEYMPAFWAKFMIGADMMAIYGGDDAKSGIGAVGGLDFMIPFTGKPNSIGLTLGVRAGIHKTFPSGWQARVVPTISISLPNDAL
jgi:hypothetical protein